MLLSLTAIALVAAAALAALNGVTKEPIAQAQQAKVENAIGAVLPAFASLEDRTVDGHVCHVGLDADGNMVGAAIEAGNDKGFGGHLQLMVGFDNEGNISGYQRDPGSRRQGRPVVPEGRQGLRRGTQACRR